MVVMMVLYQLTHIINELNANGTFSFSIIIISTKLSCPVNLFSHINPDSSCVMKSYFDYLFLLFGYERNCYWWEVNGWSPHFFFSFLPEANTGSGGRVSIAVQTMNYNLKILIYMDYYFKEYLYFILLYYSYRIITNN